MHYNEMIISKRRMNWTHPIHLHQQLVQSLLHRALILQLPAPAQGIDLVDENNGRRGLILGGLEELSYALGAESYVDLFELGAGGEEEGHAGLAGDGFC